LNLGDEESAHACAGATAEGVAELEALDYVTFSGSLMLQRFCFSDRLVPINAY